jgi:hypothetical protein
MLAMTSRGLHKLSYSREEEYTHHSGEGEVVGLLSSRTQRGGIFLVNGTPAYSNAPPPKKNINENPGKSKICRGLR